jgi:hypothetical protein
LANVALLSAFCFESFESMIGTSAGAISLTRLNFRYPFIYIYVYVCVSHL